MKTHPALCGLLSGLILATVASTTAQAVTVNLGPSKDNTIFSENGFVSNGAGLFTFTGATAGFEIRRALLAFDLSAIPAGSGILGATLTLHMSKTNAGPAPVSLHRLSADWGEGTSVASGNEGAGGIATLGDASWTHRFLLSDLWTVNGGDFSPAASATQSVGLIGSYSWSGAGLIADVQSWVDAPASNFGWIVVGDESDASTAKRFDSRENPILANRPVLSVEYELVPEPSVALLSVLAFAAIGLRRRRVGC